ncbi:MAG TPA: hypothetical protein VN754_01365 [Candidatus Binataceae bacterium]|nr:hypothetical protein [Candidatus Binataceae bacterium]
MDLEGTMQFIVNQQAQFVADMHLLQESQRELGIKVDKIGEKVDRLHEIVNKHDDYHIVTAKMMEKLSNWQEDYSERHDWLAEGYKKLIDLQFRTDAKLEKLIEAQAETESKLKSFIDEVRRNVSGGNGRKTGGKGKK